MLCATAVLAIADFSGWATLEFIGSAAGLSARSGVTFLH
jgi:hypothetical protein